MKSLNIKNAAITADAVETQTDTAEQIIRQKGIMFRQGRGNHPSLQNGVKECFGDPKFLEKCGHFMTIAKARSSVKVRECRQTDDIGWLSGMAKWKGLKSIGMLLSEILHAFAVMITGSSRFWSFFPAVRNGSTEACESERREGRQSDMIVFFAA